MSKKIKVVVALLALFFIGLISIVYFISTKIDPESIKERAVEAIEENLPGSKASIKEVSYNLGVSIKLNVKELEVSRKEGGRRLFYVKDVQVDVPVLAILTNGGTIDIKVLSPELVYEELPDNSSNWQKVFPDPAQTTGHKEEKAGRNGQEKKAIELPNFIDKSRMDLKITDLNLQYLPIGKKSANIMVNKILFKNLNLKKTTAYEVVSNIHYELDEEKVVKARMQLIGEVALNNLLQSGALDTNMLLNIEDASLSWLNIKFPALKNVIKFQMLKEGNIQAEIRTSAGSILNLETNLKTDKDYQKVDVAKLRLMANLGNLAAILPSNMKEGVRDFSFGKSQLNINGSASLDFKEKKINPNLSFFVDKPVFFVVGEQSVGTTLKGRFEGEDLSVKVKNDLLSGVATLEAETKLHPLNLPDEIKDYAPVRSKLLITNVKLDKSFIQETLYSKGEQTAEEPGPAKDQVAPSPPGPSPIAFPPFDMEIEGKHIFINNQEMNLAGKVSGHRGNRVRLPNLNVNYGPGRARLSSRATIKTAQDLSGSFKLDLKNMNLEGLNAFLPPLLSEIKGMYEGKVEGSIKKEKSLSYNIRANVSARDGELKNLNLASFIMPLVEKLSFLEGKVDQEKLKLTDKFEKMELSARASEQIVNLNHFNFVGNNRSMTLQAEGKVSMKETGESRVNAEAVITQVAPAIKLYSGSKDIPLLLEGKGFAMFPQLKYTTDKLSERLAKRELGKQKKKVEKQIEKEKNKLENELKNKAKDLLKGFKL